MRVVKMAAKLPVAAVATTLVMMACLLPLPAALDCNYDECFQWCTTETPLSYQATCLAYCRYACKDTSAVLRTEEVINKKGGVQQWYCMTGCAAAKRCSKAEGKEASACFMACGNTCANRSALPVIKSVVANA